ncbi:MAG: MBL fold metallo-hydrolase [Polyangiaceae bacterium]
MLRDYETCWDRGRPVDLVVLESTYGDRRHRCSHDDLERQLERILRRAIERRGHVLIPAFAIGRTQTLLWHLNALVEAGKLPALPVVIDSPLGLLVTETYARARALYDAEALARLARGDLPLDFQNLYSVSRSADSARLRDVAGPMVIIAGSGMCTGGRIVGHLRELVPRSSTTVVFAGYQARGTPGRALQDAGRRGAASVRLDGEDLAVRCHVDTLTGLSAHADQRELVHWLGCIPEVRRVVLHHGEPAAQHALAAAIQSAAQKGGAAA